MEESAAEVSRKIEDQYPLFLHLLLSNSPNDANRADPTIITPKTIPAIISMETLKGYLILDPPPKLHDLFLLDPQ